MIRKEWKKEDRVNQSLVCNVCRSFAPITAAATELKFGNKQITMNQKNIYSNTTILILIFFSMVHLFLLLPCFDRFINSWLQQDFRICSQPLSSSLLSLTLFSNQVSFSSSNPSSSSITVTFGMFILIYPSLIQKG